MTKQKAEGGNTFIRRKPNIRLQRGIRRQCRRIIQGAGRVLLSCGTVFILLLMMFLLSNGPAYISFHNETAEQSILSGLYSQCIYLCADKITADISNGNYLSTKITGNMVELSSESLSYSLCTYLEQAGIAYADNIRLLIESDQSCEIELTCKTIDKKMRYMIVGSDDVYIDPTQSPVLSCNFTQAQFYPWVSSADTYESFVSMNEDITVSIPADSQIHCYIVYDDEREFDKRITIDAATLPGSENSPSRQIWTFTLHDSSLRVQSADKTPLHLDIDGQYSLKLSCIGTSRIQGYLTGELVFQNTNTPKSYALASQLVDIESKSNSLNVVMCKDFRHEPLIEEALLISGEATRMDISGVNPFPDMRMWFRENMYMAPLSLLSVMISMYGLSMEKGSRKVQARKRKKKPLG